MLIKISSGNGVDEVCRALWYFLQWLEKKRYTFKIEKLEYAACEKGYQSILLKSEDKSFRDLEGTHLWRARSPFRPKHKRKNWYFKLRCENEKDSLVIDADKIIYQTMRSPKKGGQHVNKTSSGVRAIYTPLGVEAISYDKRSQYQNKIIALERLKMKIKTLEHNRENISKELEWKKDKRVERGEEVMVFEGEKFELKV